MNQQRRLFDDAPEQLQPVPWEAAANADRLLAQVVVNRPLNTIFHYLVPDALRPILKIGSRVRVPFGRGNRLLNAYCVGLETGENNKRSLKSIEEVVDLEPLLSLKMLELTRWMAERYLCGWGQVLDSVVPSGVKKNAGTREVTFFRTLIKTEELEQHHLPKKQLAVMLALLNAEDSLTIPELTEEADCGTGPINSLKKKGLIESIRKRDLVNRSEKKNAPLSPDLQLNPDQAACLNALLKTLRAQEYETFLLNGVTGSGKTEVYIQAIREVVAYGRQAIVLVPEISLTPQTIRRFRARFPSVAVLHSHLSDGERHWQWQKIARGEVEVVVGARSAVFAPTPHLGLIVIDEEHETTFKQDTTPRYHARDVARERARLENIPLLLGSATPMLESLQRVRQKKDKMLLMLKRIDDRPMPPVIIVDTRNDPLIKRGQKIGRAMFNGITNALKEDGQIILFFNLRGYTPVLWCPSCGEKVCCPHCDTSVTWHIDKKEILCHSCEFHSPIPERCPSCEHQGLKHLGAGTQKLEKEVRAKFPSVPILRMDSDSMNKPGSHDEALERFRSGEVKILLGTQMITKGLDFPNVTFVGVIDADTMLHQPDFRASERTFQLIAQVAGRTGRSDRGGRVFVQTSSPDETAIQKAAQHDYLSFAMEELKHRKEQMTPPFVHWARIILRGPEESIVDQFSREMGDFFREQIKEHNFPVRIQGPAPAPFTRIRGNFRYHLLLIANEVDSLINIWNKLQAKMPSCSGVEWTIDVDPINMR